MTESRPQDGHGELDTVVIDTVRRLVTELHPGTSAAAVRLDSALDTDLGLDSLSMAELRVRLEQACAVRLPDQALERGGTVADWVDLVAEARTGELAYRPATEAAVRWRPEGGDAVPTQAGTLGEVLDWHVRTHPERLHLRVLDHSGPEPSVDELSYAELNGRARKVAGGLGAVGVAPGDTVAIMLPTSMDYFVTFFGTVLAGAVPVPLYPPVRPAQLADQLRRQAGILDNAGAVTLVTVPEARGLARLLRTRTPALRSVLTTAELSGADPGSLPGERPENLALLQYTSGSTGDPKGVMLSHAHLLGNIRAIGSVAGAAPTDVFASWLPLYHDMGLIGAWLGSLHYGMPYVVMSPMDFVARPSRWLWAVHHHRATLSAAPNFGYELCLRIGDDDLSGLDLSSWRIAFNGAEPVRPETVRRFTERFAPYGFRPQTMAPVYGLAEAAVGVTAPPFGRTPPVDVVAREPFVRHGRAEPAPPAQAATLGFVGCGRPLPGYQVRVVDAAGQVLGERREGRVEFTGPSATYGYYRAPGPTAKLRRGDWLDTGDLGYLAGGDLHLTGRAKDVVIHAGRNLHPADLEHAVADIPGVRRGCVAVFAAREPRAGTERLVVLAETRLRDPAALADLRRRVTSVSVDVLGTPPDDVVVAPAGTILKTSSGKLRRAATRARYESGALAAPSGPVWWQAVRFAWAGALPGLRRWGRAVAAALFAAYAWAVVAVLAPPVYLAILTLPRVPTRWYVLRGAGRIVRWLTRTPLSVSGAERLAGIWPYVVAANHASYLDGLALILSLPRPVTFVAAAEFRPVPFVGRFLDRLGCEFVRRGRPELGAPDTRRVTRAVRSGRSVAFFPEGSIGTAPGLREFHLGAFAVAVDAGVPVVPTAVNGTRALLPLGHGFPRRGPVEVRFAEPVRHEGGGWPAVVTLRDTARDAVLRASAEHDTTA